MRRDPEGSVGESVKETQDEAGTDNRLWYLDV
jgi:hypothetical protein